MRVGLAAAKGLCYALGIPLITFNSLELMALSAVRSVNDEDALYCPMIDARRMEVFTAIYDYSLKELVPPNAMILNENSYADFLILNKVYFSGSGIIKFQILNKRANSIFIDEKISTGSLAEISWKKYEKNDVQNILYAQPLYIKKFYTISKK